MYYKIFEIVNSQNYYPVKHEPHNQFDRELAGIFNAEINGKENKFNSVEAASEFLKQNKSELSNNRFVILPYLETVNI